MRIVPLYVLFDGVPLRDHIDIAPAEFYERLAASSTLPTTSQPTPGDFLASYRELGAGYERIWSLHISAKLSGTYESARRAADELGGGVVRVVDTGAASLACGLLAEAVDRRLARGTTDEEVEELIARFEGASRVVFTTATLEYLQKGGRIGKAQAFAGSLLNVKPILERHGIVGPSVACVDGRRPWRSSRACSRRTRRIARAAHGDRPRQRPRVDRRPHRPRREDAAEGDRRPRPAPRRSRRHPHGPRRRRLLLVPGS